MDQRGVWKNGEMPKSTRVYYRKGGFHECFAVMKLVISHATICIQWFPLKSGEWTIPSIFCESAIDSFMCPGTTALGINLGVFCTAAQLLSLGLQSFTSPAEYVLHFLYSTGLKAACFSGKAKVFHSAGLFQSGRPHIDSMTSGQCPHDGFLSVPVPSLFDCFQRWESDGGCKLTPIQRAQCPECLLPRPSAFRFKPSELQVNRRSTSLVTVFVICQANI